MKKNIELVAIAIKEADEYIQQFKDVEGGGTCNMDTVVLLKGFKESEISRIVHLSGVMIGDKLTSRWWKGDRFIYFNISGQANRRNKMVEEANRFLRKGEIDSCIYYQMD